MAASNQMLGEACGPLREPVSLRANARQHPMPGALFRLHTYAVGTAQFALELSADVNQEVPGVDRLGGTVLHALTAGVPFGASADSHLYDERRIPMIELVLGHGTSVTKRDSRFHSTPLVWANHHDAKRISTWSRHMLAHTTQSNLACWTA